MSKEADKYKKVYTMPDADYMLTECKTGVLLTKSIDEDIQSDLFCEGVTFDDIAEFADIAKYDWIVLTEKERLELEPWDVVPKEQQTVYEPFCLSDIRRLHLTLIKHELYAFEYNLFVINQFNIDAHSLKAQRYDKDMIHAGTSDSTAIRAEKALENPYQKERKRVHAAISSIFKELVSKNKDMAEFMTAAYAVDEYGKKKYIESELMEMFDIAHDTAWRWKTSIVQGVAARLGWEIPEIREDRD